MQRAILFLVGSVLWTLTRPTPLPPSWKQLAVSTPASILQQSAKLHGVSTCSQWGRSFRLVPPIRCSHWRHALVDNLTATSGSLVQHFRWMMKETLFRESSTSFRGKEDTGTLDYMLVIRLMFLCMVIGYPSTSRHWVPTSQKHLEFRHHSKGLEQRNCFICSSCWCGIA